MPAAKDAVLNDFPYENSLVKLLQADGQIPNQDFSLRFNTWESIRDVSRILCAGATIEEVCELLDEKQANELLKFIS